MTESDYFMPLGSNTLVHPVSPTNRMSSLNSSNTPTDIDINGMAASKSSYLGAVGFGSPLPPGGAIRTNTSSTLSTSGDQNNRHSPLDTNNLINCFKSRGMEKLEDLSLLIRHVPIDATLREVYCVFALATGVKNIEFITNVEIKNILSEDNFNLEGNDSTKNIKVDFDDLQSMLKYAIILMGKPNLFEKENGKSNITLEILDSSKAKVTNLDDLIQQSSSDSANKDSNQQNYHFSNISSAAGIEQSSPLQSVTKRPSLIQKSRFSFGDPFATDGSEQHLMSAADTSINSNMMMETNGIQPAHSRDTGKALLLLESDEINDSIWGTNNLPSTVDELPISSVGSQPLGSAEWRNSALSSSNEYFIPPTSTSSNIRTSSIPRQSSQDQFAQLPLGAMDNMNAVNNPNVANHNMIPPNMGMSLNQASSFSNISQLPQSHGSNNLNNGNYRNDMLLHDSNSAMNASSGNAIVNTIPSQTNLVNNQSIKKGVNNRGVNTSRSIASKGPPPRRPSSLTQTPSANSSHSSIANSNTISQADLSLLAKVPPPANPADQNPPCNTLYVGNLPPDAAEQELRQLFSTQAGFRRLSFRNKNNNGHGHGPMCFVEFDDVSFATRALAELYGSQLPRVNASNKGGIRLSFSKNPLGVRSSNNRKNLPNSSSSYNYSSSFVKN